MDALPAGRALGVRSLACSAQLVQPGGLAPLPQQPQAEQQRRHVGQGPQGPQGGAPSAELPHGRHRGGRYRAGSTIAQHPPQMETAPHRAALCTATGRHGGGAGRPAHGQTMDGARHAHQQGTQDQRDSHAQMMRENRSRTRSVCRCRSNNMAMARTKYQPLGVT